MLFSYHISVLSIIPEFYLISWCGNFVERHSFHRISENSRKTLWKLCLSTIFPYQEISWNLSILRSAGLSNTRTWHLQKHIFNTPYKEVWPVFNYYHNGGVSCLVSVIVSYVLYFSSKIWPLSRFAPNILENYKSLKVLYIYKNYNVHSHIWKIFQNLWKVVCKVKAVQYLKVH